MKYPLAIVNKLLLTYGQDGAIFYDIGCAFTMTLANSTLATKMSALNLRMMVGSFHGHTHNRKCQLDWHPLYVDGTGNTEGEECEHVFSASNDLARATWHATMFHCHQAIEQHFGFWNADKYALLGNFLWNHYHMATAAICMLLKECSIQDRLQIQFVRALDECAEKAEEWTQAWAAGLACLNDVQLGALAEINATLKKAGARADSAYRKLQHMEALVAHLQGVLGIEDGWEIGGPQYNHWKEEANIMKYRAAIDELEHLVMKCLFELSKLGMSGTGYKLQQQIAKALQRRSEAIRKAIQHYNKEAILLNPPQPTITWKEIVDYSILSEFDLLRQSRSDVRQDDWAKPAYHKATVKFFKLSHARKEVTRIEIEVHCLRTAIHDKEQLMKATIDHLLQMDHALAKELERQQYSCSGANANIILCLDQIKTSIGYNGCKGIGTRQVVLAEPPNPEMGNNDLSHSNSDSLNDPPVHAPISNGVTNTFAQSNHQFIHLPLALGVDIEDVEHEDDRVVMEMMAEYLYDLGDD
ncbi:hypothetical protein JVT61DRAFT_10378 [Boletus reticuloceps]|uniref:Uncharacterized protein n=1 Tax=Boletus reticuloceps TaxID=495285 RepID=A0A8I2YX54_9AGAM|nr:hypothetical protein JVT61DRAFT_10378 [Boletus reticuloceps]